MALTHQKHVMACALLIEKQHGDRAPIHIAEELRRVSALGDEAGVDMWMDIAQAYASLISRPGTPN